MIAVPMTEQRVETENGVVSYATGGDGPNLILLHSLLSNRNVYDRVVPALAAERTVHLVDLPGFGETSLVEPSIEDYGGLIGSAASEGAFGEAPSFIGNGLGAFVSLAAAIAHGAAIDKLVLAGAAATFPDDARPAFAAMAGRAGAGGMEAVVDVGVRRIFSEEYIADHPGDFAERRDALLQTHVDAFTNACAALESLELADKVGAITNPVLVVVGSEDLATPPALGRQLHEMLPDSRYIELPGVAHGPQLQDPVGFLAAIGPFLDL